MPDRSAFELVYGFQPRYSVFSATNTDEVDDFVNQREQTRRDAMDLAQTRRGIQFDRDYRPPESQGKVWLKLVKAGEVGYRMPASSELTTIKTGPLKIVCRVGDSAYELHGIKEDPPGGFMNPTGAVPRKPVRMNSGTAKTHPGRWRITLDNRKPVRERKSKRDGSLEIQVKWKGYQEPT
ncbi:hypothetical protein LTR93_010761 [Exophiala xenobiotica]|nr:hypothetical protein LTR93_010761 [Exophiala xenobiotica]